jgi:hypothetical protein
MTGYTVHTGSSKKFSSGWDRIFQGGGGKKAAGATPKPKKSAKKKSRG